MNTFESPLPDDRLSELHQLATAALNENLSDEQGARLDQLVCQDEEFRKQYIRYMYVSWNLRTWAKFPLADDSESPLQPLMPADVDEALLHQLQVPSSEPAAPSAPSFLGNFIHGTIGFFSQEVPFAMLTATIITSLGLLAGSFIYVSHHESTAQKSQPSSPSMTIVSNPQSEYVGRITGMVDVKWSDATTAAVTELVALDRKYALASGLMEITYDSGAKVILQGPVTYEVDSRDGGFLSIGKLTACLDNAKPRAGDQKSEIKNQKSSLSTIHYPLFTIKTPTATVTDLGTEFGVEVSKTGATETHVLRGAVEMQFAAPDGSGVHRIRMTERQAARVEVGKNGVPTLSHPVVQFDRFVRYMPVLQQVPISVFSTGVNLARGNADPHWRIVAVSNSPNFKTQPAIVSWAAAWSFNIGADSQWISTKGDLPVATDDTTYTFQTTFELPADARPGTAKLTGWYAADNHVCAMRLNGRNIWLYNRDEAVQSRDCRFFHIDRGFKSGKNVLEIDVMSSQGGQGSKNQFTSWGSAGKIVAFTNTGDKIYWGTGLKLEADKIYTVTVAIGSRLDVNSPGCDFRLRETPDNNGGKTPDLTHAHFSSSDLVQGAFVDKSLTLNTKIKPGLVGKELWAEVESETQTNYDNFRVDVRDASGRIIAQTSNDFEKGLGRNPWACDGNVYAKGVNEGVQVISGIGLRMKLEGSVSTAMSPREP